MLTPLSDELVAAAKREPLLVRHGGREITLRRTQASGRISIDLEVVEGAEVLGYITSYDPDEYGAMPIMRTHIAPRVFRTLEGALDELLS